MRCYKPEPDPFPAVPPPNTAGLPRIEVVAAARTDVGQERSDNQDRAFVADASTDQAWEPPVAIGVRADASGGFYAAVCDGMGGEAGGALASELAVETIVGAMRSRWVQRNAAPAASTAVTESLVAQALVASLEAASARIKVTARDEPVYARMGTTATVAVVVHGVLLCAQIGDSRAYVLREGRLVQLTEDQTMAELLRKSGAIPPDQIANIVGPNVILQALGSSTRLDVALTRTPLESGDVVLLCSDGLYGAVDDANITRIITGATDLGAACDALVSAANAAGGPDNISCVLFRCV